MFTYSVTYIYPPNQIPVVDNKRRRIKFTQEEDAIISKMVSFIGPQKWKYISDRLPNRTPRQIRERWVNYLSPKVSRDSWSNQEDELILNCVEKFGRQWSKFTSMFENRTDIAIKNRYNLLRRRELKKNENDQGSSSCSYTSEEGNSDSEKSPNESQSPPPTVVPKSSRVEFPFLTTIQANQLFPNFDSFLSPCLDLISKNNMLT